MSVIVFKVYSVCWKLLAFILINFCKTFCCRKLYITPDWLISFFFLFPQYVALPAWAKLDQVIDKFYFIKIAIEHFICSYWKPAWFEKLYQLSIAIGMVDSQVVVKNSISPPIDQLVFFLFRQYLAFTRLNKIRSRHWQVLFH